MSSKLKTVKNVTPQYMTFLWSQINKIREAQSWGQFAYALKLATTLIGYLPKDMKDKFLKRANKITTTMNNITSGNIKSLNGTYDVFHRHIHKTKRLEQYANRELSLFIQDLTSALDEKNYMEQHRNIPRGYDR